MYIHIWVCSIMGERATGVGIRVCFGGMIRGMFRGCATRVPFLNLGPPKKWTNPYSKRLCRGIRLGFPSRGPSFYLLVDDGWHVMLIPVEVNLSFSFEILSGVGGGGGGVQP